MSHLKGQHRVSSQHVLNYSNFAYISVFAAVPEGCAGSVFVKTALVLLSLFIDLSNKNSC